MEGMFHHSSEELYTKALQYKQDEDYDNFAIYLTMAANYGHEMAQDMLFKDADMKKQNYSKTLEFYIKTSYVDNDIIYGEKVDNFCDKNGYSIAYLGYMYDNGYGVVKNIQKANELHEKAIMKNIAYSMNALGYAYDRGTEVPKDYIKAVNLFEMAVKKGYSYAMSNLALMYQYGTGVDTDYNKAIELCEMAIDKGDNDIIKNLMILYKDNKDEIDKDIVIKSLSKINQLDCLKEIYGYGDDCISFIKKALVHEKENDELKKEIDGLKNHIMASPDGKLYFEAKASWEKNKKIIENGIIVS